MRLLILRIACTRPDIIVTYYDINPSLIRMVSNFALKGNIERKDPQSHSEHFVQMYGSFKINKGTLVTNVLL